jgi:hypothetical protein
MTMTNAKITAAPSFKAPRSSEWQPLASTSEDDDSARQASRKNKEELHSTLLASLQMQHLVVLSGSGCSLGAGGPSMTDLWNEVVGDIFPTDDAENAAKAVGHDISIENVEILLSRIEASLQLNSDKALETFLSDSKKKILTKCSAFLGDTKDTLEAHRTFIHRLSRRRARDHRLKVFTTNYDLCFERAAGELGAVALDGFSFTAPRRFDPRFYDYDIVRRARNGDESASYLEGVFLLYKLHGSVNWARKGADNSIYEELSPKPEEACLIYPAAGKYQQSFTQPHLESMAQYLAAVREPNTCVIVAGFGFNDDHLSTPLLSAVSSNPHLRLIVVDPAAEKNLNGGNAHWKRMGELNQNGDDIWFIAANFGQFATLIPDLKSLTPADALTKAIQGIARTV